MGDDSVQTPRVGSRLAGFIKSTVLGGALVLVPISIFLFIIAEVVKGVRVAATPLADLSPVKGVGGIGVATILAVAIVLAVSFLLGLLIQTAIGRAMGRWCDGKLGRLLPGYRIVKRLSHQVAGRGEDELGVPVLVRFGANRQFGFLVEEHASGEATVFIPSTPALTVGSLQIFDKGQVEKLNVSMAKVANCITRYGVGSSELISRK